MTPNWLASVGDSYSRTSAGSASVGNGMILKTDLFDSSTKIWFVSSISHLVVKKMSAFYDE